MLLLWPAPRSARRSLSSGMGEAPLGEAPGPEPSVLCCRAALYPHGRPAAVVAARADRDGDLLRLGLLALRQDHAQHAVLVLGLDLLGIHHAREREGPAEGPVGALDPVVALALDLVVEL